MITNESNIREYNLPDNMLELDFIHWKLLNDTINEFIASGIPPRDVDLRDRFMIIARYVNKNRQ